MFLQAQAFGGFSFVALEPSTLERSTQVRDWVLGDIVKRLVVAITNYERGKTPGSTIITVGQEIYDIFDTQSRQ